MASEPVLPKEIFELLIEKLGQDLASYTQVDDNYWKLRQTLVNLALSCQSFRDQCTRYLYHTLPLWGQPIGSFNQFTRRLRSLIAALAIPRGPALYVRKVTITIFPCAGISAASGEEDAEHDYMQNISGRWITHFLKSLPHLLRNLSGIRHFRLESRIKYPDFTFALIQRPARAAILRCLRESPLETLEVDSVAIPWELLCALPRSLQCLKLGGSWWLELETGRSAWLGTQGSDDYLVDKESEQEPPLTVSPKVLHFNLYLDFAKVIARQTRFFSHLNTLTYTLHDSDDLQHLNRKILPAISANLQELVLQLDSFEISISGANELRDTLQSSLHAVISLPTLETLGFIINYTNYAGRIACPPRLIEIVDGYISQTVLPQIRALQITTTWNPRQACYPSPSRELDYEAFDGSWDTLDTSLTGLPTLELFKLTLMIEDESIRQDSSAIELLRSQREAEMAVLFPNARSRGMKVVMICGIIYRDFHIFSPNVR